MNAYDFMDINAALAEVQEHSETELEVDTAVKWGARAAACYRLYAATGEISWFERATNYSHEALEHAATSCDGGEALKAMEAAMAAERMHAVHGA